MSPTVLEVAPGVTENITATFSLQNGFDTSRVPVYSGYIHVSSSAEADNGALTVPFLGVAVDMTTLPLFNDTDQPSTGSMAKPRNETIADDGSTVFSMVGKDVPTVNVALTFPSRVVRVDVLPVDLDTPTDFTFAGVKFLGLFLLTTDLTAFRNALVFDSGAPRSIIQNNEKTLSRFPWNGFFVNGTQAPDGQYRLGVRALKMLAKNLDDQNNWETFISSPFTVKASPNGKSHT